MLDGDVAARDGQVSLARRRGEQVLRWRRTCSSPAEGSALVKRWLERRSSVLIAWDRSADDVNAGSGHGWTALALPHVNQLIIQ